MRRGCRAAGSMRRGCRAAGAAPWRLCGLSSCASPSRRQQRVCLQAAGGAARQEAGGAARQEAGGAARQEAGGAGRAELGEHRVMRLIVRTVLLACV